MKKVTINVRGRVQGVGFRYNTKALADRLDVYGTVKNEMDGSVFIQATGSQENIDHFIKLLEKEKPPFSSIDSLIVNEKLDLPDFTSFKVIY
ncbi:MULTISPECIES: acylphosphatase [unclassified Jeotgalibaca]|uniref:acylphosphatase n=1 Tax=unclassified Jeotgalibaca TaxID=2621505 RepID=UPI003FD02845